jgi:hypothetical protein
MRALFGATREPAHVAVLAGGEKIRKPGARLGTEFGPAEADCIEAERQRAITDQVRGFGRISRVACQVPGPRLRRPT